MNRNRATQSQCRRAGRPRQADGEVEEDQAGTRGTNQEQGLAHANLHTRTSYQHDDKHCGQGITAKGCDTGTLKCGFSNENNYTVYGGLV